MAQSIRSSEFLRFNEHLCGLVRARVPLDQGLRRMAEELRSRRGSPGRLRRFVETVSSDLERGKQLSEAIGQSGFGLPEYYVSLVRAGEASGSLADVLHHIVTQTRRQREYRHGIVSSLAYPALVTIIAMGLVTAIASILVPQLIDIYAQLGADLPLPTLIVVNIVESIRRNLPAVVTVLCAIAAIGLLIGTGLVGRTLRDAMLLNMPLAGPMVYSHMIVGFTRSLGYLLAKGVAMVDALALTQSVVVNRIAQRFVAETREDVERGKSLSEAMEDTTLLAPSMRWMIRLAEERGDLGPTLMDIGDYYEARLEERRRTVETLIEPAIIAILGVTLGVLIITLYLPLFYIPTAIR